MTTKFGSNIRRLRKQRFWSQQDLAEEAGVKLLTLKKIELGHTETPRPSTIQKIAAALDIAPRELNSFIGDPLTVGEDPMRRRTFVAGVLAAPTAGMATAGSLDIDVSGNWFAAWQTSADYEDFIATHPIEIAQEGATIEAHNLRPSNEHPKGGYLWRASMELSQGAYLCGMYSAIPKERQLSRGTLFFHYRSQQEVFFGRWVGTSHDGEVTTGFAVIAKHQDECRRKIGDLIDQNVSIAQGPVPIVASIPD